jgi:carbamoyl-phosphate synthase large subunit
MLRYLALGVEPERLAIRPGWYLRSLTEQYVAEEKLK